MGRKARVASSTGLYHVIVRGNNKQKIFHSELDFEKYLNLIQISVKTHAVKVYHYCLMTNHVHLLLGSETLDDLSKVMHSVQRGYHHYYRKSYTFFGHLFQGRYRSLAIEDDGYLIECGRYIERNPVRAKLVKHAGDWGYSSYSFYAYGQPNDLLTPSVAYLGLSNIAEVRRSLYRDRVDEGRPYEEVLDKELLKR